MDFIRVGDKIISLNKIQRSVEKILKSRSHGHSQQEVAEKMGVDRSFVSRLENLGEVRKGKNIGVVGFPIKNKNEIINVLNEFGIENYLLFNDEERKRFVAEKNGADLVNELMALLKIYRNFDTVIIIASDMRTSLIEALFDHQVISLDIGSSPITEDVTVDTERLRRIILDITSDS